MKIKKLFDYIFPHPNYQTRYDPIVRHGTDEKDTLYGHIGRDALFGHGNHDYLFGKNGDDYLNGGAGKDLLSGGKDHDMLLAGDGNDRVYAGKGNDILYGEQANDLLSGSFGQDYLHGGLGNDRLFGGSGRDILNGSWGNDTYYGGRGCDHFQFTLYDSENGLMGSGHDTIRSFKKEDTLEFIGNIHSLEDLASIVTHIKHYGSKVKIYFEGDNSLTIYGIRGGHHKIKDVEDLANVINIKFGHEYRTIDGEYNNLYDTEKGKYHQQFIRLADSEYADGLSAPSGDTRPSARHISNTISATDTEHPNSFEASDMFWLWGQFIDHDIDLTSGGNDETMPITVPIGDPYFDPYGTGTQTINFTRSGYDPTTGDTTPREHFNEITAFIDASMVYGSTLERASYLRASGGKLKTSENELLPYNLAGLENAGGDHNTSLFLAGDIRANENVALTGMHTLFVREHNRLVDELQESHPEYTDEQLYQEAKRIVEAKIQAITYNEFLPLLLGEDALSEYEGYDASIDPQISNIFATAAYRLGHTLLSDEIERLNEDGSVHGSHLSLREAFFRPDILTTPEQMEAIFRGVSQGWSESIDTFIVEDVRSFLFGPPGSGGLDLASLNIQRGRDHGLPDYNSAREAFGLDRVEIFADITSNTIIQDKLESLYGTVDNIDVFIGGLAEDPLDGSMLGPLFQTIILDQFTRLRDGDRFWYENRMSAEEIDEINQTTLSDIIKDNTGVDILQNNPFLAYQRIGGDDSDNILMGDQYHDLLIGFDGADTLLGLGGDDELYGLADNDILTGGLGNDRFVFNPGEGIDTITDFNVKDILDDENDLIDLSAFEIEYDSLEITQDGADTVIGLGGSDQILLLAFDMAQLSDDDFVF